MKKLFLIVALLTLGAIDALAQTQCVRLRELDGSPDVNCVRQINVTNGTLSCSGNICTLTTGGGGGGGSPGGLAGEVQWNDTGAFNGTSGLTATATTVTIVSGVTGTFSTTGNLLTLTNTTNSASLPIMLLRGNRSGVTSNDEAYVSMSLANASAAQKEIGRITWAIFPNTAGAEGGRLDFSVADSGTLAKRIQLSPGDLSPSNDNVVALGESGTLQWSDLFLGSGAVIGFDNSNVVLTHSSGILTMGTGELRITTVGTNTASVPTLGSSSILSNKTLATGTIFAGYSDIAEIAAPANPSAGSIRLYADSGTGDLACLNSAGGDCLPSGSSGLTVGTTTVTSGTAGRLFYEAAGNVLGEISTLTSDGALLAFASGVTTGTGATSGLNATANSLTTGDAFTFSSSSVSSGNVVSIAATGTAAASNTKTALNVATSGANATSAMTTYSGRFNNTSTGTTSVNVGLQTAASGGATNWDLQVGNATQTTSIIRAGVSANPGQVVLGGAFFDFAPVGTNATQRFSNGNTFLGSAIGLVWASTTSWTSGGSAPTVDTGFTRAAAGAIRASNASTGAGSLILGTSAGAIGTSGAGVLAFTLSTTPSTSPTDTVQFYSADSAAADHNVFSRNEAGEVNRVTGLAARNSAQFDKTNDTLATATGLTRNVEAGRTYAFRANLQTISDVAAGVKFAVSGTATATAISYEGVLLEGTAISAKTRGTALDTTVCAVTAVVAATCQIEGVIQVNAAGTLLIQFAQNATNAAASSVLANQYFQLIPIS